MSDAFLKGSSLVKALGGRARPHKVFTVEVVREKGAEPLTLAVRSLSTEERQTADARAREWFLTHGRTREDLVTDAGESAFNLEAMVQILAIALVEPTAPSRPFAGDADEVRRCFEVDEVRAIFDEWTAFQSERSPFRALKTWAEVEGVADALGKGLVSTTSLPRYDVSSLRNIITSLCAQRAKWMTRSSLDTSPPSPSPPEPSPSSDEPPPSMAVSETPLPPSQG